MNQKHEIVQFQGTMELKPLVRDYLMGKPDLAHLYTYKSDAEGVLQSARKRLSTFTPHQRELLTEALRGQYQRDMGGVPESVEARIQDLSSPKTATLTTGHQLNLAGGPLFFVYKVAAILKMARKLNKMQSEIQFVPVFWMASEDHDLEEIDHFRIGKHQFHWETKQRGAVGRMRTEQLASSIHTFCAEAGIHYAEVAELLKRTYSHATLAGAHRYLVHEVFANEPILVLDGDDTRLKQSFAPVFDRELRAPWLMNQTSAAVQFLERNYHVQVNPRPCNLFYLEEQERVRIDEPNRFIERWEKDPACISPNAIMRPLYQEWILPNAAYIGGPAEVAYWLQLKPAFDDLSLPYPAVCLRPSYVLIDEKWEQKRIKLGLSREDVLQPLTELFANWVRDNGSFPIDFADLHRTLRNQFDLLRGVAHQTDHSFTGALNAQEKKQIKGLEMLEKRWLKAEKRRHSEMRIRMEQLLLELFQNKVPVERIESVWSYYAQYGHSLIAEVIKASPAFDPGVVFLMPKSPINP